MSNKSAAGLTPSELADFDALQNAQRKAQNTKNRAEIAFAEATQNYVEFEQDMQRKYKLKVGDRIEANGTFTRK